MIGKCFVDTNILVYQFDESDSSKQARAQCIMRKLWHTRLGRISHQVLQEFYVTTTRKLKPALKAEMARQEVRDLFGWSPVSPCAEFLNLAWEIEERWQLSWWDSLIVAAARQAGCETLLSEDMQDGLDLDGLRIVNPFADSFDPATLA